MRTEIKTKEISYQVELDLEIVVHLDKISYTLRGVLEEVNGKIEKVSLKEVVYKDPLGDIMLGKKTVAKIQKILKENITGNSTYGFAISKPFYTKLEKLLI